MVHNHAMGIIVYSPRLDDQRAKLLASAVGLFLPLLLGCQAPQPMPQVKCIHFTGTEHRWQAEYELQSGDRLLAGPDLHVPVGSPVVFILKSNDYIYTIAIPAFGLKEIAVPDLEFRMSMCPLHSGEYPLIGQELCGLPGQEGPGRLIVEPAEDFEAWFDQQWVVASRSKRLSSAK
jgi:heme/copper-type cytochrome/quinol oxidase subunit 2